MKVACPQCGEKVPYTPDNPHRPFCSERCRMIDLGCWMDGSYAVEGDPTPQETDACTPEGW